jgi:hypothetical protein
MHEEKEIRSFFFKKEKISEVYNSFENAICVSTNH